MRTESFIGLAAVLLLAIAGVVAYDVSQDEEPSAVESPSPSASPSETQTPEPTETVSPTPTPSPTPSPTASPSPSPSPSPTDDDTEEPTDDETDPDDDGPPTGTGDNASAVSRTAVSFGAGSSRFDGASAASRASDFDRDCAVIPNQGETFTQCEIAWSSSQRKWWAVTETAAGSNHTATVWRHDGGASFERVLATSAYGADMSLGGPVWPNHNDVLVADFGGTIEVLAFDSGAGPRVAGVVPMSGGASHLLIAQQVFVWTSGSSRTTTVLDIVPGSPLAGHRTNLSGGARGPEEVALMAYRAWVNRNRSAAQTWITAEVDEALFEDSPSQGGDLFSMDDTRCRLASGTYTCTFRSSIGTMNWHIRSVNGVLRVVAIDSST